MSSDAQEVPPEMPELEAQLAEVETRMASLDRGLSERSVLMSEDRNGVRSQWLELEVLRLRLKAQEESLLFAYALREGLWEPGALIPVCWDDFSPRWASQRAWVRDAVAGSWEANSALRFQGWDSCNSDDPAVRIHIDNSPEGRIGVTRLGVGLLDPGERMILKFDNIAERCTGIEERCIRTIAIHEFGHALALAHEQNRDDPENPSWCREFEQGTKGDYEVTVYDLDSIMNYCSTTYSFLEGRLSSLDIEAVQVLYGKPS